MRKQIIGLFLIFAPFFTYAQEYTIATVPNDLLEESMDYVSNPDGIISYEAEEEINRTIQFIRDSTTAEIAVVLLNSIGYEDIDEFATELFNTWGIGRKENNNGLLFILVMDVQEMVFRTGYGLEGVLPDIVLHRIIRDVIAPKLKNGDFDAGVKDGIEAVQFFLLNPEAAKEITNEETTEKFPLFLYFAVNIVFLIISFLIFWLVAKSDKTRIQKYRNIKTIAIVFIFFAIFIQSLLLSSILFFILRRRIRNKPVDCTECGKKMKKASEAKDNNYLTHEQDTEEIIKSIDYDVWLCSCGHIEIYPYKKISKYTACPKCMARAYCVINDVTLIRATTYSTGKGQKTRQCKSCGYKKTSQYTIPMITSDSDSSSSGSSSSSSGGSWGGGSSGGGGARGGW